MLLCCDFVHSVRADGSADEVVCICQRAGRGLVGHSISDQSDQTEHHAILAILSSVNSQCQVLSSKSVALPLRCG